MKRNERKLIYSQKLTPSSFDSERETFICPHCGDEVQICFIKAGEEKLMINKCYCYFCGQRFQVSREDLKLVIDEVTYGKTLVYPFYPLCDPVPKVGRRRSEDEDWDLIP